VPLIAVALLAQLSVPMRRTLPVLAFPERGLDDSAAYEGYRTRLYRDAADNTVQIYIDRRTGRLVTLLADAEDESVALSATDAPGEPARLAWDGAAAEVGRAGSARVLQYALAAEGSGVTLGSFLLGSMRVERDFQYARAHDQPFGGTPFILPEYAHLVSVLQGLRPAEQRQELAALHAGTLEALRGRLRPAIVARRTRTLDLVRITQPALDGRDTLVLEIRTDPERVESEVTGDRVVLRARAGTRVPFTLRIVTRGRPLTPLSRGEILNAQFLHYLASVRARAGTDSAATLRARWLEREVRELELLSSREKVMAGLPNYATYFGRDMLLTTLMMRPIWRERMSEFVIASALRNLSPTGVVSHEEAIGWQALREAAAEYTTLMDSARVAARAGRNSAADALRRHAHAVLRDARRVRQNYHMIDANFQLPIVVARWMADPRVPAARKRAFLLDSADTDEPRLRRLLRELALVSRLTAPYVASPLAVHLVSFPRRDSTHWQSASWRDSDAGYAGGRFAMDVNAIWAPRALVAVQRILTTIRALGIPMDSVSRTMPELHPDTPLGRYARDPAALRHGITVWSGAVRHFLVQLPPDEVRSRVTARLAAMPVEERRYWAALPSTAVAERDSLSFLALSLDTDGRPIDIVNTDPAMRLFLDATDPAAAAATGWTMHGAMRDVRVFVRPYPVGLLVDRVGPVVANDAYASPTIWPVFERDEYHGPRVVWGREVNLFLLGVTGVLTGPVSGSDRAELWRALRQVRSAVDSAGFSSELWSYRIADGHVHAVRYDTGSDVQLWSTSDLAVQFALHRLRASTGRRTAP